MSDIFHQQKVQLHNFIVKAMMPDLKPAIQHRMKALELSKDLKGEQFRVRTLSQIIKLSRALLKDKCVFSFKLSKICYAPHLALPRN